MRRMFEQQYVLRPMHIYTYVHIKMYGRNNGKTTTRRISWPCSARNTCLARHAHGTTSALEEYCLWSGFKTVLYASTYGHIPSFSPSSRNTRLVRFLLLTAARAWRHWTARASYARFHADFVFDLIRPRLVVGSEQGGDYSLFKQEGHSDRTW